MAAPKVALWRGWGNRRNSQERGQVDEVTYLVEQVRIDSGI